MINNYNVTFDVVNGTFAGGATQATVSLPYGHVITAGDIPASVADLGFDQGNGAWDLSPTGVTVEDSSLVFTYTYDIAAVQGAVTIHIPATLIAKGPYGVDVTGWFKFTIEDEDGNVVATGTNDADGNISFSKFDYTAREDEGVHTFTVREVKMTLAGWVLDGSVYTVQVGVGEVLNRSTGGYDLTATINSITMGSKASDAVVFTNLYTAEAEPPAVTITATKMVEGTDVDTTGWFKFAIADEDGNVVATGTNDAHGNIDFGSMDFTSDEVGTHTYYVTEAAGTDEGWTYDSSVYAVTVTVTDGYADAAHTIHDMTAAIASVTKDGAPVDEIVFTNVYTVAQVLPAVLPLTTPKTGDLAPLMLLVAALMAAAGACLVVRSRRRRAQVQD